jgi:hypothetical protein
MLMMNNHFALFQLPGNLLKTKKCALYFRGNTEFLIYFTLEFFNSQAVFDTLFALLTILFVVISVHLNRF